MISPTIFPFEALDELILADLKAVVAEQREAWETECERLAVAAQEAGTDCVLDDFVADGVLSNVNFTLEEARKKVIITRSFIVDHYLQKVGDTCDGTTRINRIDAHMGWGVLPTWKFIEPREPRNFADQFDEEFE